MFEVCWLGRGWWGVGRWRVWVDDCHGTNPLIGTWFGLFLSIQIMILLMARMSMGGLGLGVQRGVCECAVGLVVWGNARNVGYKGSRFNSSQILYIHTVSVNLYLDVYSHSSVTMPHQGRSSYLLGCVCFLPGLFKDCVFIAGIWIVVISYLCAFRDMVIITFYGV